MIYRRHKPPLSRLAAWRRLGRNSLYYAPRPVPAVNLVVMRRIDEQHLNYPFVGTRMPRGFLRAEGIDIGHENAPTMMRRMEGEGVYRRPNTSKPVPGQKIYVYLLRGRKIERPNQIWAEQPKVPAPRSRVGRATEGTDIAYSPTARGFVYLAAVVD